MSSETSQVEYHIIDVAHPEMKAIYFHQENIDWCCGNGLSFTKITHGFVFVPGRNKVLEMLQDISGYNLVLGTAVCLTTCKRKRKRGKNNGMKSVIDTTYERMLTLNLNVSNKEKSEYVKIWKQLMDKCKKTGKITPNYYVISSTFFSCNGNLNLLISSLTLQLRQIMVLIEMLFVSLSLNRMKSQYSLSADPLCSCKHLNDVIVVESLNT